MQQKLNIGDRATVTKSFSPEEVRTYADICGDHNPIHLDAEFAAKTVFGQPIVHGMLVASLFSGLIGEDLPGQGSIYLGQNLSFKAPVFVGEAVTASVEVIKIRQDKPIATLETLCLNGDEKVVIEGEAVVKFSA